MVPSDMDVTPREPSKAEVARPSTTVLTESAETEVAMFSMSTVTVEPPDAVVIVFRVMSLGLT